jgi:hypothetical protein
VRDDHPQEQEAHQGVQSGDFNRKWQEERQAAGNHHDQKGHEHCKIQDVA